MKLLVFLSLITASVSYSVSFDSGLDESWRHFKRIFDKSYSGNEEVRRRLIFEDRVYSISLHNIKADLGLQSYRRGLNRYSDLSHEEYLKVLNGFKVGHASINGNSSSWLPLANMDIPEEVDWRKSGLVTPVKDQGMCGSCWAFSVTGSLEGQHKKKTGQLVSLSEQNLLDCVRENHGCEGGWMDPAYEYIINQDGIDTENSYPYVGIQDMCFFSELGVGATCRGFVDLPEGDETSLMQAVATVGPISVAIDASDEEFHTYKSGIYDNPNCPGEVGDLTHAVLVVGYGTENGKDYWLVKNSWGTTYGMDGYVKMSRNKNNQCGIATRASYPLV